MSKQNKKKRIGTENKLVVNRGNGGWEVVKMIEGVDCIVKDGN